MKSDFKRIIAEENVISYYIMSRIASDGGALNGFSASNFEFPGIQTFGCFGRGEDGSSINH